MTTLLVRIFGGKVQAFIFFALVLGFGIWFKLSLNKAEQRGYQSGKQAIIDAERKRINEELAEERQQLAQQRLLLDQQASSLAVQRRDVQAALNRGIGQLASRDVEVRHEVESIPDPDVNDRFRAALARARIADTKLATIRSTPTE